MSIPITTLPSNIAEAAASGRADAAVHVVCEITKLLENEPLFNAGRGSVFTREETHELEASIMDGQTRKCGACSLVKHYRNPIAVAKAVMEHTPHVYMAGEGAEALAAQHCADDQVTQDYFSTEIRREQLKAAKQRQIVSALIDHTTFDQNESNGTYLGLSHPNLQLNELLNR